MLQSEGLPPIYILLKTGTHGDSLRILRALFRHDTITLIRLPLPVRDRNA